MCIEVRCGSTRLILDAGSGLRALGQQLCVEQEPVDAHLVLSHLHIDHVMGLTQFAPFWRRDTKVMVHAPGSLVADNPRASVFSVLYRPLFPVDASELPASIGLIEHDAGETFEPGPGVLVRTFSLSHQGVSRGICVEYAGRKLCYVTDHEHGDAVTDQAIASEVKGADLLIYDATFTDAEMPAHRGWGHSSWEEGVRLKRRAEVKLLALAHHDPDRTDAALDRLSEKAARAKNVFFSRQGMELRL